MKKIKDYYLKSCLLLGMLLSSSIPATAQKTDTLALYNMPSWYYYSGDSWDYGLFNAVHEYENMRTYYGGAVSGDRTIGTGVWFYCGGRILNWYYGYQYWEIPNIDWFAVGAHADTSIRVAGVAMFYPRDIYHWRTGIRYTIRDEWISHGCDRMLLQLMDTALDVQAEGKVMLADSLGKLVFKINGRPGNSASQEVYEAESNFSDIYDVYEAWFSEPVTVSDSFYLALRLEDSVGGFHSVPVPGIYERIWNVYDVVGPLHFDFPPITWKARGKYRHFCNDNGVYLDSVENPDWFTYNTSHEPHGYMLIFPILAEDCGVHGEVTWDVAEDSSVTLHWNPGSWDTQWEVSFGPSGTLPDDGTVISAVAPSVRLDSIAADSHYVAYVRSKCTVRDTTWSDWTDSLSIFVSTAPAPPIEDIASVEARAGVDLQPNPAAATALLTAAVPFTAVEVYTAAGTLYKRQPAAGLSLILDVSSWPSGTYLLLVSTEAGTVTRRLVVTH